MRRGLTRLWILLSVVWLLAVAGAFALVERNHPLWWGATLLLPQVFVDGVTGKIGPAKLSSRDLSTLNGAIPPWQYYQLSEVDGDLGRLSHENYEALRQTMLSWTPHKRRLPDWTKVEAYAPTDEAADRLVQRYWETNGGWWEHPWAKWLLAMIAPPLVLYILGTAVGWVIAGFRSHQLR
jgi:hypothetical protein